MSYEYLFLRALLLTVFSEALTFFVLLGLFFRKNISGLGWPRLIFASLLPSITTLPYLWFVLPAFLKNRVQFITVGELSVFLVEAVLYFFVLQPKARQAIILSLVCNAVSVAVGLCIG